MNPWRGSNHSNQNLKLLSKLPVCTFCLFFHFHGLSYPQVKHSMLKCINPQIDALLDTIVNQFQATFFPDSVCNLQQLRLKLNMVFPLLICHSIQVFKTFSVSPSSIQDANKSFCYSPWISCYEVPLSTHFKFDFNIWEETETIQKCKIEAFFSSVALTEKCYEVQPPKI